jgi:uncharacterized membrane protein
MTDDKKFEILLEEIGLIQSRFDKYDDLVYRSRKWFITLWLALVGISFRPSGYLASANKYILYISLLSSLIFYLYESGVRYSFYRFVDRYREVRSNINNGLKIENFYLYDLSNHYRRQELSEAERRSFNNKRLKHAFVNINSVLMYLALGGISVGLICLFG